MARAPRRSPEEVRRPRPEGAAASRTPAAGRRHSAWPWHRTDSCLRVRRSGRAQQLRPRQSHRHPRWVDWGARAERAAEHSRGRLDRAAVARVAARAARHIAVRRGLLAARARRERVGVAEAAREGRRVRQGELPRRPMGCRRTGKTCWWAGSMRRTACTRSCEKLPRLELWRAHLRDQASGAYPFYCIITQLMGILHAPTAGAAKACPVRGRSHEPDQQNGAEPLIQPRGRACKTSAMNKAATAGDQRAQRSFSSWMRAALPVKSRK